MKLETADKITKIIKEFNKDKKRLPKLWNPDTDIFNSLNRLKQNIKFHKIEKLHEFCIKKSSKLNKKGNELFDIYINDKICTPSKNGESVSLSAVRQYCQMLSSLDLLFFYEKEGIHIIKDKKICSMTCYFNDFLNDDVDFIKLIFNTIVTSLKRDVSFIRNLGFSLFLYICYKNEYCIPKEENIILQKKVLKLNNKYFLPRNELGLKSYILKMSESYKNLEIELRNLYDFDSFISEIYTYIFINKINKNYCYDNAYVESANYLAKLHSERTRLRENIIKSRVLGKLKYQDLEPINEKDILPDVDIKMLDAAHIFDVWRIGTEIKRSLTDKNRIHELISFASNPNNGILICKNLHSSFDKGYWNFDVDGEMIIRHEHMDDFRNLKLVPCRIKKNVLTKEMQLFIMQRM